MALADYALNVFGSRQLGDVSLVEFSLSAGAGDAARIVAECGPNTSVDSGSHAGGVYILSWEAGTSNLVLGFDILGSTRTVTASLVTVTNNTASITLTVSGGSILLSSERLHVAILAGRP